MGTRIFALMICGLMVFAPASAVMGAEAVITTAAGSGVGDGGLAIDAGLCLPQGVVADQAGNLYIADMDNRRIRKVSALTGIISTYVGTGKYGFTGDGGPAVKADIGKPYGVAMDQSGNLYFSDYYGNSIHRVDAATGIIWRIAGGGYSGYGGDGGPAQQARFYGPAGIALDRSGNLFIADQGNFRIRRLNLNTGTITTVAGNGQAGYSGDGGPAYAAQLSYPNGVTVNNAGDLFIADTSNHRIRRVDARSGIISTVAGNGQAGYSGDGGSALAAQIMNPSCTAIDPWGNLLIADGSNHIRRVDGSTGIITTIAGGGYQGDGAPAVNARLNSLTGMIVDQAGNLLVSEASEYRIRRISVTTGVITTIAGCGVGDGRLATDAILKEPTGVAVDSAGVLYLSDHTHHLVRRKDPITGILSIYAGNGSPYFSGDGGPATSAGMNGPSGLAFDSQDNLYIMCDWDNRVRRVDRKTRIITTVAGNGLPTYSGDGGPATQASLNYAVGIRVDSKGNVLIADTFNHRIRRVNTVTGIITTIVGTGTAGFSGDGGPASYAKLYAPWDLELDSAGNLYIADAWNSRVRKVDAATGIISTIVGTGVYGYSGDGGLATAAQLSSPYGIRLDSQGNLYIGDIGNHRVRKVTKATGIITTVAGDGVEGFTADGAPAISAHLDWPYKLAVDGAGNLYFSEEGNERVRMVSAAPVLVRYESPVIRNGWNCLSVPADPLNPDPLAVFASLDVPNSSLQFWRNDITGGGYMAYGPMDNWYGPVKRGTPYWVLNMGEPTSTHIDAYPPTADFQIPIPGHHHYPFWMMIGAPFPSNIPCESLRFTNPTISPNPYTWEEAYNLGLVEATAQGFDCSTGGYFSVGISKYHPEVTSLQPWNGYWLLIQRPESLTITIPKP